MLIEGAVRRRQERPGAAGAGRRAFAWWPTTGSLLWASGGRLFGRAPDTLAGLLEVRGLRRAARSPPCRLAEVALVAALRRGRERMPGPAFAEILRASAVPLIEIDPREASAPAKLRRALSHFDAAHKRRI